MFGLSRRQVVLCVAALGIKKWSRRLRIIIKFYLSAYYIFYLYVWMRLFCSTIERQTKFKCDAARVSYVSIVYTSNMDYYCLEISFEVMWIFVYHLPDESY